MPSYTERKQLVDRVPELPMVPVVKMPVAYQVTESARSASVASEIPFGYDGYLDRVEMTGHHGRRNEHGRNSQRRRKTTRRRVVPIVQEDSVEARPGSSRTRYVAQESVGSITTDDSTYGGSVDATPVKHQMMSDGKANEVAEPNIQVARSEKKVEAEDDEEDEEGKLGVKTEGYVHKKHITKLDDDDFGSTWLNALSNETWNSEQPPSSPFGSVNPMNLPTPMRAASQSIVSTGRSIG